MNQGRPKGRGFPCTVQGTIKGDILFPWKENIPL